MAIYFGEYVFDRSAVWTAPFPKPTGMTPYGVPTYPPPFGDQNSPIGFSDSIHINTGDFTVECLFHLDYEYQPPTNHLSFQVPARYTLVGQYDGYFEPENAMQNWWALELTEDMVAFKVWDQSSQSFVNAIEGQTPYTWPDTFTNYRRTNLSSEFVHVRVVRFGNKLRLWVNGVRVQDGEGNDAEADAVDWDYSTAIINYNGQKGYLANPAIPYSTIQVRDVKIANEALSWGGMYRDECISARFNMLDDATSVLRSGGTRYYFDTLDDLFNMNSQSSEIVTKDSVNYLSEVLDDSLPLRDTNALVIEHTTTRFLTEVIEDGWNLGEENETIWRHSGVTYYFEELRDSLSMLDATINRMDRSGVNYLEEVVGDNVGIGDQEVSLITRPIPTRYLDEVLSDGFYILENNNYNLEQGYVSYYEEIIEDIFHSAETLDGVSFRSGVRYMAEVIDESLAMAEETVYAWQKNSNFDIHSSTQRGKISFHPAIFAKLVIGNSGDLKAIIGFHVDVSGNVRNRMIRETITELFQTGDGGQNDRQYPQQNVESVQLGDSGVYKIHTPLEYFYEIVEDSFSLWDEHESVNARNGSRYFYDTIDDMFFIGDPLDYAMTRDSIQHYGDSIEEGLSFAGVTNYGLHSNMWFLNEVVEDEIKTTDLMGEINTAYRLVVNTNKGIT